MPAHTRVELELELSEGVGGQLWERTQAFVAQVAAQKRAARAG
jgi:hypothetical protein